MRSQLALLMDYFVINSVREKRNFIRLFLVFLCIWIALLGFNSHSQFISDWQNAKHAVSFIIAYSIMLILFVLFVALITAGLQIILAYFLAYSLAFRRVHNLGISVGDWIESEDYRSHRQDFLKRTLA